MTTIETGRTALVLNRTLTPSPTESSTQRLSDHTADSSQGLDDVGDTVFAHGGVYGNGEAMTGVEFEPLPAGLTTGATGGRRR